MEIEERYACKIFFDTLCNICTIRIQETMDIRVTMRIE